MFSQNLNTFSQNLSVKLFWTSLDQFVDSSQIYWLFSVTVKKNETFIQLFS